MYAAAGRSVALWRGARHRGDQATACDERLRRFERRIERPG